MGELLEAIGIMFYLCWRVIVVILLIASVFAPPILAIALMNAWYLLIWFSFPVIAGLVGYTYRNG